MNQSTQQLIESAVARIDSNSLTTLLSELVDIASPSGEEATLAQHIVDRLQGFGLTAHEQVLDNTQSNAWATLKDSETKDSQTIDSKTGQFLLLYSPIDTVTSNSEEEDCPWVADELRSDMRAKAVVDNGHIYGLGAHNPKGHAACIMEVARILSEMDIELGGNLYFGFGAGGMPTNARDGMRTDSGHGAGCDAMLTKALLPDSAIIAKSGWAVSWEEVGFQWFDIIVEGSHTYVGSRHLLPYSNAIGNASQLIVKLEQWFEEWAEKHCSGLSKPQGVVSFIESGWERMPAFTPACCRFRVDLRVNPHTPMQQAEEEFRTVVKRFSEELGIVARCEKVVEITGTHTSPESAVITETIAAWEHVEQRQHQPRVGMSGATDANILRMHNVDTARVGLPKANLENIDFQLGMNAVNIDDMVKLTSLLLRATINLVKIK